jgi:hypothetical protein
MQRKIIQGVPFWIDGANRAFYWESSEKPTSPIQIGNYNVQKESVELFEDWRVKLEDKKKGYIESQSSRPRKVGDK